MQTRRQGSGAPPVRVIGKAVAILEALSEGTEEKSLADICRRLDENRSTAYRILGTLELHGLVRRSGTGRYRLGTKLFELGSAAQQHLEVRRVALPHLRHLAETLNVSAFLSLRDQDRAVCIERVDRGPVHVATYQVGTTLPLTVGAGPFVLLAAMPDDRIDDILESPITPLTARTITDPKAVRRRVAQTREDAVSWSDEDVAETMAAVGSPIVDSHGNTVASLSIAALRADLFGASQARLLEETLTAAHQISRELGYSGPWPSTPLRPDGSVVGAQEAVAEGRSGSDVRSPGRKAGIWSD